MLWFRHLRVVLNVISKMNKAQFNRAQSQSEKSVLEGLWVVLVNDKTQGMANYEGRVPVMAKSGDNGHFLLGFKNVVSARKFVTASSLESAEPRMVVKANQNNMIDVAKANGVVGILVDYDPKTQQYESASAL